MAKTSPNKPLKDTTKSKGNMPLTSKSSLSKKHASGAPASGHNGDIGKPPVRVNGRPTGVEKSRPKVRRTDQEIKREDRRLKKQKETEQEARKRLQIVANRPVNAGTLKDQIDTLEAKRELIAEEMKTSNAAGRWRKQQEEKKVNAHLEKKQRELAEQDRSARRATEKKRKRGSSDSDKPVSKKAMVDGEASERLGQVKTGSKKRKADGDAPGAEGGVKKARVETAVASTSQRSRKRVVMRRADGKDGSPRGLFNHDQMCFANVVTQTFAAALVGKDLDTYLGVQRETETFGAKPRLVDELKVGKKMREGALSDVMKEIREKIVASAEEAGVSVADYLHEVLESLRVEGSATPVSPFFLQKVFAYANDEDAVRVEYSGDTQEDCILFYEQLLNVLSVDLDTTASKALQALFQIDYKESNVCPKKCTVDAKGASNFEMYHRVVVPPANVHKGMQPDLQTLLDASTTSILDEEKCGKCGSQIRREESITVAPENLVIKIERCAEMKRNKNFKTLRAIDLSTENTIHFGGEEYRVDAVTMHHGKGLKGGHYSVYRKHAGQWWLLDDDKSAQQDPEDSKGAQSAMLLLKKVQS